MERRSLFQVMFTHQTVRNRLSRNRIVEMEEMCFTGYNVVPEVSNDYN